MIYKIYINVKKINLMFYEFFLDKFNIFFFIVLLVEVIMSQ